MLSYPTMLETLITNKTRIKLMMRFFLNPDSHSYLRGLETEFGESTNSIRIELKRFEKAGMLESFSVGNKKVYKANAKHPLYSEIRMIIQKHIGIDQVVEKLIQKLGNADKVYLTGNMANGIGNGPLELLLVGENINKANLNKLVEKVENLIRRSVLCTISDTVNSKKALGTVNGSLLLWEKNNVNV
jgi:hypothetical protein